MQDRVPSRILAAALALQVIGCAAATRRAIEPQEPICASQQFGVVAVEVRVSHGIPAFTPSPMAGGGQGTAAGALAHIIAAAATVPPIRAIGISWLATGITAAPIGPVAGGLTAHLRAFDYRCGWGTCGGSWKVQENAGVHATRATVQTSTDDPLVRLTR